MKINAVNVKSIYIHIPFCSNICSYCDFCKMLLNNKIVDEYLLSLEKEIKKNYKGETIKTIYIGGGTPSCLKDYQLLRLFSILKIIKKDNECEFTFECNIEDITEDLLVHLKKNGVNRLSIGVQSFNHHNLVFLNRNHNLVIEEKILLAKKYFANINIDVIYALFNQTMKSLKKDLKCFLKLGIPHISTYSLIIEKNTVLAIKKVPYIDEELDYKMYKVIRKKLKRYGYEHYEISNFAKKGYASKHNLTYWNNDFYYGFGLGASGYLGDIRYENTRSISNYNKGEYRRIIDKLDLKKNLENAFMLGLRKIDGIDKKDFYEKYGFDIHFDIIKRLLKEKKLMENEKKIYINYKYIYISNSILTEIFMNLKIK